MFTWTISRCDLYAIHWCVCVGMIIECCRLSIGAGVVGAVGESISLLFW